MQYVIIARDHKDEKALERRMSIRPEHLIGAKQLKANGQFVVGGAILNDSGAMDGSVMIVEFETEEQFQHWYNNEPYIKGGVWGEIEVRRFRVADV